MADPVTPVGGNHQRTEWALGIPKAKASVEFFPQEDVEVVELEAPVMDEDPSQGVAAAAATVLAWGIEVDLLWASSQLFNHQSRHR